MVYNVQNRLFENTALLNYLRTHSYWYKYLNRDASNFNKMQNEYKEMVRKAKVQKASDTLSTIEMLTSIVNTLK